MSKKITKKCTFLFFSIYDENFHLLRSGDKKSSTGEGAAGGERRIWERMEKIGRIEKSVIPILLIQLVTICNRLIH